MGRAREIADLIGGTTPDIILKPSDGAILNLQTSDTTVTSSSVLGAINFQAPDEASGTDAILLGAGIDAVAEGTFSASSNATKLSFKTASSAAASETMSLSSAGLLTISDDLVIGDGKTIGSATTPAAITIASNGLVTIARSDNAENLSLVSTDADASVGPTLRMDRQSASAADGDLLGKINFVGHNDAGTPEDIAYAGITAIINDASDGTEDGKLAINTIVAGTERSRVFIDASETVLNEDSIALDFRVESNGLTNAFVIDGGNNGIGFNHTPRSDLHTSSTQTFFGTEGSLLSQRDSGLGIPGMTMTQNVYIDSDTGNYAYMTTNEATKLDLKDGVTAFSRAASGTAGNAITFSESMRIDTSGNLAIGTTSAAAKLHVQSGDGSISPSVHADELLVEGSANAGITVGSGTSGLGSLRFADSGGDSQGNITYNHSDNSFSFATDDTEAMKINSSQEVAFGNSDPSDDTPTLGFQIDHGGGTGTFINIGHTSSATSGYSYARYMFNGSMIGSISQSGTSGVAYNTSSDYRLKENVVTDWDATSRLKQLKPSRFNFKADKDTTVDGFLAHEVSDIVPEAISGEKDAVDKDGKIEPQAIDQSKLVPLLTKSLQEAIARIDTLEAEVKTLKG